MKGGGTHERLPHAILQAHHALEARVHHVSDDGDVLVLAHRCPLAGRGATKLLDPPTCTHQFSYYLPLFDEE